MEADRRRLEEAQRKLHALEQQAAVDAARRLEDQRRAAEQQRIAEEVAAQQAKASTAAVCEATSGDEAVTKTSKLLPVAEVVGIIQGCLLATMSADIVLYYKRKDLEKRLSVLKFTAARKIQCAARQMLARRKVIRVRIVRADAVAKRNFALTVQADADAKALEQQRINDQIAYQVARTNAAEEEKRAVEARRVAAIALYNRSALKIQCAYRCYNARFMLRWKLKERHDKLRARELADFTTISHKAAIKIQCLMKRFVAVRKVARMREDKQRAKDELQRKEQQRHAAAVRIQCMYRSFNARFEANWRRVDKRRRDALLLDKKKQEENQAVRAVVEKEMLHKKMLKQRAAAITIQCAWRCYNAKFELMWRVEARAKRNSEQAARKQGAVLAKIAGRIGRGYLDRKKLFLDRAMARNLAAQELLLAEYEADSVINQVLDAEKK
jgi:hypothetical protein